MSTKIEIILKKCDLHQWKSLSITTAELENRINEKKRKFNSRMLRKQKKMSQNSVLFIIIEIYLFHH